MDQTFFFMSSMSCAFIAGLLVFFGFFAYLRFLRYKETITLAEKGLIHPSDQSSGKGTLRWGLAFVGLGSALCLGLYPIGWAIGSSFPLQFGPWMLAGLLPAFFGLSLLAIYYLTNDKKTSEKRTSGQDEMSDFEEEK